MSHLVLDNKHIAKREDVQRCWRYIVDCLVGEGQKDAGDAKYLSDSQLTVCIAWITSKWEEFRVSANCPTEAALSSEFVIWLASEPELDINVYYSVIAAPKKR